MELLLAGMGRGVARFGVLVRVRVKDVMIDLLIHLRPVLTLWLYSMGRKDRFHRLFILLR